MHLNAETDVASQRDTEMWEDNQERRLEQAGRAIRRSRPSHAQGEPRLRGPPSCRGASGKARNPDRRVPANLRAGSLTTTNPRLENDRHTMV
ncbi:hypothetical protein PoB_002932400 [Plakobranchus ocellatus]|uniref:Uncharacterized protein n=1 Tax=Plakobranchus ocellatus TaxID=259542 RepID=A0AAV4A9B1_9GAST|nr:hypothetical protein PoB_002932400 [Plakobranchus ocellatus]